MTVIVSDKVLHRTCWSYIQMIATDEVRCEIEFCGVRARGPWTRSFGGVCVAIRQYAIRLTGTIHSQIRHNWGLPRAGAAKVVVLARV